MKNSQWEIKQNYSKKFSNFLKIKNSIFVNSGSSANLLIAQSLLEADYLKIKLLLHQLCHGLPQLLHFCSWGIKWICVLQILET